MITNFTKDNETLEVSGLYNGEEFSIPPRISGGTRIAYTEAEALEYLNWSIPMTVTSEEVDLKYLRQERNAKLTETDWVITMHKELGTNIPAAWKTYRQALRDITDTYTSLDDVVWPEKPE